MLLTDICEGQQVRITETSETDGLVWRRLLDFGVMEGTLVKIKRVLPLGGPIAIEAKGQLIGIRRRDAKMIRVELMYEYLCIGRKSEHREAFLVQPTDGFL